MGENMELNAKYEQMVQMFDNGGKLEDMKVIVEEVKNLMKNETNVSPKIIETVQKIEWFMKAFADDYDEVNQ